MKKIAPLTYEVGSGEGLFLSITCQGTAYLAFGSVNGNALNFVSGNPVEVTPNMLSSADKIDRIHLHLVYQQGATKQARYDVEVLDDNRVSIDTIPSPIDTSITLPYRDDIDLVVLVR